MPPPTQSLRRDRRGNVNIELVLIGAVVALGTLGGVAYMRDEIGQTFGLQGRKLCEARSAASSANGPCAGSGSSSSGSVSISGSGGTGNGAGGSTGGSGNGGTGGTSPSTPSTPVPKLLSVDTNPGGSYGPGTALFCTATYDATVTAEGSTNLPLRINGKLVSVPMETPASGTTFSWRYSLTAADVGTVSADALTATFKDGQGRAAERPRCAYSGVQAFYPAPTRLSDNGPSGSIPPGGTLACTVSYSSSVTMTNGGILPLVVGTTNVDVPLVSPAGNSWAPVDGDTFTWQVALPQNALGAVTTRGSFAPTFTDAAGRAQQQPTCSPQNAVVEVQPAKVDRPVAGTYTKAGPLTWTVRWGQPVTYNAANPPKLTIWTAGSGSSVSQDVIPKAGQPSDVTIYEWTPRDADNGQVNVSFNTNGSTVTGTVSGTRLDNSASLAAASTSTNFAGASSTAVSGVMVDGSLHLASASVTGGQWRPGSTTVTVSYVFDRAIAYVAGSTPSIKFKAGVNGSTAAQQSINITNATASGSALTMSFTVPAATPADADGVENLYLFLNGGSVRTTSPSAGSTPGLNITDLSPPNYPSPTPNPMGTITVADIRPTVSAVSGTGTTLNYNPASASSPPVVSVNVTFSEAMRWMGTAPKLQVEINRIGGSPFQATMTDSASSGTLAATHTYKLDQASIPAGYFPEDTAGIRVLGMLNATSITNGSNVALNAAAYDWTSYQGPKLNNIMEGLQNANGDPLSAGAGTYTAGVPMNVSFHMNAGYYANTSAKKDTNRGAGRGLYLELTYNPDAGSTPGNIVVYTNGSPHTLAPSSYLAGKTLQAGDTISIVRDEASDCMFFALNGTWVRPTMTPSSGTCPADHLQANASTVYLQLLPPSNGGTLALAPFGENSGAPAGVQRFHFIAPSYDPWAGF